MHNVQYTYFSESFFLESCFRTLISVYKTYRHHRESELGLNSDFIIKLLTIGVLIDNLRMYEWYHLVAALFWLGGQFAEGQMLNSSQPIVCISGNTVVRVQNMCKPGIGKNNFSKNKLLEFSIKEHNSYQKCVLKTG